MRFCSEIQFFAIFNGMRAIFLAEAYNNGGPHHSLIHRRIRIKFFGIGPGNFSFSSSILFSKLRTDAGSVLP